MKSKLLGKKIILIIVLIIFISSAVLLIYNRYLFGLAKEQGLGERSGEVYVPKDQPEKFTNDDGYEYYIMKHNSENVVFITKYNGDDENIIIPETIDGYTVERIDDSAFTCCNKIKTVDVHSNITYMGMTCFGGCKNLESITVYGNETEIGLYCFCDCPKVKIYCKKDSKTHKYVTENNVTFEILE